jgi:hypothetical protein
MSVSTMTPVASGWVTAKFPTATASTQLQCNVMSHPVSETFRQSLRKRVVKRFMRVLKEIHHFVFP